MKNKEYNEPHIKIYLIKANVILAGSLIVGSGETNEQNAKTHKPFFEFEDNSYENL